MKGRPDLRLIDTNSGAFDDLDAVRAPLPESTSDDADAPPPPRRKRRAKQGSVYLWASKILLGLEGEDDDHPSLTAWIPQVPCELEDIVQRLHCSGVFDQLWRQTFMTVGRTPPKGRTFPVVHVPADCPLPPQTVREQLGRLAKAGLIEIVERRSGVAIRVRFKAPPPELRQPLEWTSS
jgi:hypothetical protein